MSFPIFGLDLPGTILLRLPIGAIYSSCADGTKDMPE